MHSDLSALSAAADGRPVLEGPVGLVAPLDRRAPLIDRLLAKPRRVLFFGKSMSRTRATGGLVEALEGAGIEVRWVNIAKLRRWIGRKLALRRVAQIYESFAPDLIFVFCRDLPRPVLERFSAVTPVTMWLEEPLDRIDEGYVEYMRHVHAVFMTNPAKLPWLYDRGIRHAAFNLEGFSPTWHYPLETSSRPRRDLAFIGGPGRDGIRAHFLAEIARHFPLQIYGKGWDSWRRHYPILDVRRPVGPRGYRRICATTRILLGINQVNNDPLYFSNRTLLTLACRGFHLTHYVPKLETVFRDSEHLAWYEDVDTCLTRIEHFLTRPGERDRIARQGCELVLRAHQFRHRVEAILARLLPDGEAREPTVDAARSRPMAIDRSAE